MNIELAINQIIIIGILSFVVYYLTKIENCVCASKIPEKKYLKEWFIIQIIITFIALIITTIGNYDFMSQFIFLGIYMIFVIINLINLARLFIYIKKLRELKCNCGMLKVQNYLYYDLMIGFYIISFVLIILLIFGIYMAIKFFNKSHNKNKKLK